MYIEIYMMTLWHGIDFHIMDPLCKRKRPGARPTSDISIEFEIWPKCAVLCFETNSTDNNEILHTSRQLHYRDMCKISLWSVEIPLVGQAPGGQ